MATVTKKMKVEYTLEEIQRLTREGKIRDILNESDQIGIVFDGEVEQYDVIGIDAEELADENLKHSITIQAHRLIEERPFDTKGRYGSNVWETSELREYLNSKEYAERYEELVPFLTKVKKINSNGEKTEDLFFLLSKEEYEPSETPYEFYKERSNRIKQDEDGYGDWHLTRSAYRGNSCNAWCVLSSGYVGYYYAVYAHRCAPACTIG